MKTITESYQDITDAYMSLAHLTAKLTDVQTALYHARKDLKDQETAILTEYCDERRHPKGLAELGSNKENRDAKLSTFTADEQERVSDLEAKEMALRADLENARLLKDLYKAQWEHVKLVHSPEASHV